MKVLHIATGHPLNFQGGIQNYVRSLINYQSLKGITVHVLTEEGTEGIEGGIVYTINTSKLHNSLFGNLYDDKQYAYVNDLLSREQYDLIHVHLTLAMDWRICELIENYNYVVSLHDYNFLCPRIQMMDTRGEVCLKYDEEKCSHCIDYFDRYRLVRGFKKVLGKNIEFLPQKTTHKRYLIYKKFLESANLLLPVSNRVKEIYMWSGICNEYKVIHIGNISAYDYTHIVKRYKKSGKITIAMLGTLTKAKGAELFISIAERVNNKSVEFVFYGNSAEYKDGIERVGIIDKGPYKQTELSGILEEVDCGLVLSIWEDNAPQVVMELLNNHIPVIATMMGGIPDFINEENGFLFDPYNEDEINKVINFINDMTIEDIKSREMCIKPTPTPEEHAFQIFNIYQSIVNSGNKTKEKMEN